MAEAIPVSLRDWGEAMMTSMVNNKNDYESDYLRNSGVKKR